jgi:glucosyl-3-phosphoglycerate synthase
MSQINPAMRKMVVFDMDNALLQGRFIDVCAKKYNFKQALDLLRNIDKNSISFTKRVASFLQGKPVQELTRIADDIPLAKDIEEVVKELKERGYLVCIITDSYQVIANRVGNKIGADWCLSYELDHVGGTATGHVRIPAVFNYSEKSSCDHPVCKTNAFRHLCEKFNILMQNTIVIGGSENDLCMIRHAGIGVAFCASSEILTEVARKNITQPLFRELLEVAP